MTLKNLFGLALRQTTGLVESVLHLCGLSWSVPDFSMLCRRQFDLNVQVPYTRSQAGLHLLVDSTGIKFLGEGEWKCKKHSPERRRQWRKLHIDMDAKRLQIRAICVTSKNVSDAALEYAKAKPLCIGMQRSLHAEGWGEVSGNIGLAITGEAW